MLHIQAVTVMNNIMQSNSNIGHFLKLVVPAKGGGHGPMPPTCATDFDGV